MKLVHKSLTSWTSVICAFAVSLSALSATAQQTEYLSHYDPAKGFKPAQANLTEIFLQIAGSLECYGSPEPYIRHMQREHSRVSRLYAEKTGKQHNSRMPAHMTEAYIDQLVKNWNTLSGPLKLDALAREAGRCAREGILGTRGTGTLAVEIFNRHQKLVAAQMRGDPTRRVGFTDLKREVGEELEFGKTGIDMAGYETTRRDAVSYAFVLHGAFQRKFRQIEASAAAAKAAELNEAIAGAFFDLGYMAQSELEIGILESALRQQ